MRAHVRVAQHIWGIVGDLSQIQHIASSFFLPNNKLVGILSTHVVGSLARTFVWSTEMCELP